MELNQYLDRAAVSEEVFALRPDYRVGLLAVSGIEPGASDERSDALLKAAEQQARQLTAATSVEELAHIASWREAYRSFGAKPQRTRNSLEALTRRAVDGLPRVNRLTDIYNAISVAHQMPLGGEDLDRYDGAPRLIRATGSEAFDTAAGGEDVTEFPPAGEVVWCDASGVTCRRWNWRQGRRTQLTDGTTSALFILDALDPVDVAGLSSVIAALQEELSRLGTDVHFAHRIITQDSI